VVDDPTGEGSAQQKERKDEQEAGDAFGHEPARQRSEEIANAKIFAPSQQNETSDAAHVHERAPDGPPGTGGVPGRSVAPQPKEAREKSLANEHKHSARRKEKKRASPADLSEADAFFDFLRGVQKESPRNWHGSTRSHD
jgi:hypothetical protein